MMGGAQMIEIKSDSKDSFFSKTRVYAFRGETFKVLLYLTGGILRPKALDADSFPGVIWRSSSEGRPPCCVVDNLYWSAIKDEALTPSEFDDIFTAVEFGFANRQDYYNQCSTWRHLHQVDVPTIMLTAADDPFIPVETYLDAQLSDSIILHIEPVGGHVGYYAGNSRKYGTNRWLDYFLEKSFRKILDGSLVFEKHSQKALIHAPGAHRSSESDKSRSGWNHLDRQ
jgi:pimeloyl-ACP methyl ester carboxylesterase